MPLPPARCEVCDAQGGFAELDERAADGGRARGLWVEEGPRGAACGRAAVPGLLCSGLPGAVVIKSRS